MPLHFVCGLQVHRSAAHLRVVCDHADRNAVQAGERGYDRTALITADLEHRPQIEHRVKDPARIEDLAAISRNRVLQPVIRAFRIVVAGRDRGELVDAARHVREEAPHLCEGVVLAFGFVVDQRAAPVHREAAEFVLVDLLTVGLANDMRTGCHHLGLHAHHHRKVGGQHLERAQAYTGSQRHPDHGHSVQQFLCRPGRVLGDLGAAKLHQQFDAPAGRIHQPHQGQAQLVSHALDVNPFVGDRGLGGSSADCIIVDMQGGLAPVDMAGSDDGVRGLQCEEAPIVVVPALAGDAAELAEAAGVDQRGYAFARVHATRRAEALQRLGSSHPARRLAALRQLAQLFLPLAFGLEFGLHHASPAVVLDLIRLRRRERRHGRAVP